MMEPKAAPKNYQEQLRNEQISIMRICPVNDTMHRHAFFELVYITRGRALHRLGTDAVYISAGDFFIIDTGTEHCYQETERFELINCLFLPEYIDRALVNCPSLSALLSSTGMRFGVPVTTRTADRMFHDDDGSVLRLMEAMEQEANARQTGCMELIRCHLTHVLIQAARRSEQAGQEQGCHPAVGLVAQRLQHSFREPLELPRLAAELGYAPQYLSAVFRRETGMSLQTYVQRLRVEQACVLLTASNRTVAEVAQLVGYGDAKFFLTVFKRCKGMSPRQFRMVSRKNRSEAEGKR